MQQAIAHARNETSEPIAILGAGIVGLTAANDLHRRGLPVRGQRTRTNARTRKGPRKARQATRAPTTTTK